MVNKIQSVLVWSQNCSLHYEVILEVFDEPHQLVVCFSVLKVNGFHCSVKKVTSESISVIYSEPLKSCARMCISKHVRVYVFLFWAGNSGLVHTRHVPYHWTTSLGKYLFCFSSHLLLLWHICLKFSQQWCGDTEWTIHIANRQQP